jgi:hypothetical protein
MDHIDFIHWATLTKSVISFAEIFNVEIIKINNPTILKKYICIYKSPRRDPYFDVVVGLVWSHDPKSYAGGSVYYW